MRLLLFLLLLSACIIVQQPAPDVQVIVPEPAKKPAPPPVVEVAKPIKPILPPAPSFMESTAKKAGALRKRGYSFKYKDDEYDIIGENVSVRLAKLALVETVINETRVEFPVDTVYMKKQQTFGTCERRLYKKQYRGLRKAFMDVCEQNPTHSVVLSYEKYDIITPVEWVLTYAEANATVQEEIIQLHGHDVQVVVIRDNSQKITMYLDKHYGIPLRVTVHQQKEKVRQEDYVLTI